ncbi:nucleoredoxin-like protein 2 [Spea bombifrons]|uniref:nucleoredoxin-like protein 2 n=1 Tax=Spea bombifrons TaxID=233779 RepID=UPI00234B8291|nr:nucleoredoxin-like protein 2 [Spea bombifrons]
MVLKGRGKGSPAVIIGNKALTMDVLSGHILVNKDGDRLDPEDVLQNKIVGLYFSAGWCSPCKDFTPILCDFYSELMDHSHSPPPFEIVFISSDKSADDMVDYMNTMHGDWLALPWHDSYKHELKNMYKVVALPRLVIVKPNGEVITDKGRKHIRERGLACFRSWLEGADVFQNFTSK